MKIKLAPGHIMFKFEFWTSHHLAIAQSDFSAKMAAGNSKHRHAMHAWAILWNVDNVDKTGRSEEMVELWVIYLWCFSFLLLLLLLFSFLICKIDLSLISIKQTVIQPAFPETRDSLIPQKSIFKILSIIRTLANTISI